MKPEPLKGKTHNADNEYFEENTKVFKTEDIKSAVEWLKQEIDKEVMEEYEKHNYCYGKWLIEEINKIIDKAFEDVVK